MNLRALCTCVVTKWSLLLVLLTMTAVASAGGPPKEKEEHKSGSSKPASHAAAAQRKVDRPDTHPKAGKAATRRKAVVQLDRGRKAADTGRRVDTLPMADTPRRVATRARPVIRRREPGTLLCGVVVPRASVPTDRFDRSIATVCTLTMACTAGGRWSACTTEHAW